MARKNHQTNTLIKWTVIAGDLLMLNALIALFKVWHPYLQTLEEEKTLVLWVACNLAMVLSQWKYSTIIHLRIVSGGDILQRVFKLTALQTVLADVVVKAFNLNLSAGWLLTELGACLLLAMTLCRVAERSVVKRIRLSGRNTKTAVFIGADPELTVLHERLLKNPTLGYRVLGYYANEEMPAGEKAEGCRSLDHIGTLDDLLAGIADDRPMALGDEVYVCLSRRDGEMLRTIAAYCDQHVIHFYFVPKSVECIGMRLKREFLDDMELFTTHEFPMQEPLNKAVKRTFDIVASVLVLLCMLPLLPVIAFIIRRQSPGPVFFRQERTGNNGRSFICYKFRSMHVNQDADRLQATEQDERKFPFGALMRKYNIDELPQFWNVLKGDMSIVGPRPHMLYHTEYYKGQIGKYMVRHFAKPGITGWAQVTGFRGETKELWQMEERVRRDIWYIEHWSVWLDLRIMWMTFKTMVWHDEHAY